MHLASTLAVLPNLVVCQHPLPTTTPQTYTTAFCHPQQLPPVAAPLWATATAMLRQARALMLHVPVAPLDAISNGTLMM